MASLHNTYIAQFLATANVTFRHNRGAAWHRGSVRASHPAAPGSNPVSTRTHFSSKSAQVRDFTIADSGEGLIREQILRENTKKPSLALYY